MKLSIIIPIYNVENYLSACLDSVTKSNSSDYEVIAVNDGSTDNSSTILNEYCKNHPDLIITVDKENGGLGSARNAGLKISSGEYVVFLDSDDYLAEGAVDRILEIIDTSEFDICFFDQAYFNEVGQKILYYKGADRKDSFSLETYPQILFYTPNAGNKIIRKSLFSDNDITFPPRQWFEDVNSIYLLYPHANTMIYIPEALNCHLQRKGSITNSANTIRNLEMIKAATDLYNYYSALGLCSEELEYCIFYNELLTSVDRVNLIDRHSAVQDSLVDWFISTYPKYKTNSYIKKLGFKYKLLSYLIFNRKYTILNYILKINAAKY